MSSKSENITYALDKLKKKYHLCHRYNLVDSSLQTFKTSFKLQCRAACVRALVTDR